MRGVWKNVLKGKPFFVRLRRIFPGKSLILAIFLFSALIGICSISLSPAQEAGPPLVKLTAEERAWLDRNAGNLQLLFNISFPPIEFASPDGGFVGMGADVMARVEQGLGVRFPKIPSDDWNRHLKALESGECAIAPTIVSTPERQRYAFFTTPYATVPVVIISAREPDRGLSLADLAGRRVAVVSGYATETYLHDTAEGRFDVVPMPDVPQALRAASFGQVDAFVENLAVAAYYIRLEGIPNLRVVGSTDYTFDFSIGVSRRYPLLFSAVQKALAAVPEKDLEAIRDGWISLKGPSGFSPEIRRLLMLAGAFTALLLLGLAAISYVLKRRLNEKIASLKTAQQDLVASEARFRTIFDHAPYAIVINSFEDGRFLDANKAFLESRDITKEEITFLRTRDFTLISDSEARAVINTLLSQGYVKDHEAVIRKKDGTEAHVLYSSVLLEIQDRKQVLSMTVDVTAKKQAEKALKESEARFRSLFRKAPLPLAESTREGKILAVNDRFVQVIGYDAEAVESLFRLWEMVCPDPKYRDRTMSLWTGAIDRAMASGSEIKPGEYRITCKDGTDRVMLISASIIGESLLLSFVDLTAHRRAEDERERLRVQLLQAQKLEAVGILAGGVAHDFNNILGTIIGYSELLIMDKDLSGPVRSKLEKILDAALRSADLTRQLLAFARKQTVAPKVFDLNEAVGAMLKMLRRMIGENIALEWRPETAAPCLVKMDPTQLDQILANLCVNARNAISGVGRITIETGSASFNEADCLFYADCMSGDYVRLCVGDTGCGMEPETMAHIFEPFFTTREVGQGTGLGLATVYGIVRQNNGFIHVESAPGVGSMFHIHLPRPEDAVAAPPADLPEGIPHGRGETILLVEDDPTIREMCETLLEGLGYQVLTAATPGAALRLAAEHPADIALFITDVVMPEMNGRDLADRLLALRPGMRHIFMSGYTADVIVHQGVLDEGIHFIQKPFSVKDVAVKIRTVLDPN